MKFGFSLALFRGENQIMQHALRPSALVPDGFAVESAVCDGGTTLITVRPTSNTSACPRCGARSDRIHSRYLRHATDLPPGGPAGSARRRGAALPLRCCPV